jgi:branched-chain amino acid transport system substrate-binding protein
MKGRAFWATICLFTLVAAAGCGGSDGGSSDEALEVGYGAALTGGLAPFDTVALNGLEMGLEEINAAGGADGRQINLTVEDMKSDPSVGASVGRSLVSKGISVLITPCDQDPSIAVGQAGQAEGIPSISSCAGSPTLPGIVGDYMFIDSQGANQQGAALADYAYNTAGYRNAYVLETHDFAFGLTTPRYFAKAFEQLGGKIVGKDTYKILTGDFSAQIAKIKSLDPQPDVIQQSGFVPDPPTFVKQLRAAGVDTPVIGTDGSDSPLLMEVGGQQVEGYVFTTHAFPTANDSTKKFYADYEAKYGKPPESSFAAVGYDLSKIIAAAVEEAGSTDPTELRDAINELVDVQGATGPITYKDRNRIPLKNVALVQVKDGKLELLKYYIPDPELIPEPDSVPTS